MKIKFYFIGLFALTTLAVAAPHVWTLKDGSSIEGDYFSSGSTTVVLKRSGTNYLLKISDLSTNDLAYSTEMQFVQRQDRLGAEVKQMKQAGMMEFTKETLMNCNTEFLTQMMNDNN